MTQSSHNARTMTLIAVVLVPALVIGGAYWWNGQRPTQDGIAALGQLAAADLARAEQVRIESAAQRQAENAARRARLEERGSQSADDLTSYHPSTQCDAALRIGRMGAREHVPALIDLMSSSAASHAVRNCAASALVTLGEHDVTLRTFLEWSNSDAADLQRNALSGFAAIGPAAAPVALPFFARALQSTFMDLRYVAVDALARLGPAAEPLLRQAAHDTDAHVRARAEAAIATLSAR